jgi:hypothetical protein
MIDDARNHEREDSYKQQESYSCNERLFYVKRLRD